MNTYCIKSHQFYDTDEDGTLVELLIIAISMVRRCVPRLSLREAVNFVELRHRLELHSDEVEALRKLDFELEVS